MDRHLADRDVCAAIDLGRVPEDFQRAEATDNDDVEFPVVQNGARCDAHAATGRLPVADKDGRHLAFKLAILDSQRHSVVPVAKRRQQERPEIRNGAAAEFSRAFGPLDDLRGEAQVRIVREKAALAPASDHGNDFADINRP